MAKQQTQVEELEVNLDEILGTGADSVMVPNEESEEPKKKGFFSKEGVDLSFLDKKAAKPKKETSGEGEGDGKEGDDKEGAGAEGDGKEGTEGDGKEGESVDDILKDADGAGADDKEDKKKKGRPANIVALAKNLIEKNVILPFDDDKKLEDYTLEDFQELMEMNFEQTGKVLQKEVAETFFESLPPELQQAYVYYQNGGDDMKGFFQELATSKQIETLDTKTEGGQIQTVRAYLMATGFGTPEEIEAEIVGYQDRNELEKKANQFHPHLESMQKKLIDVQVAEQKRQADLRMKRSKEYTDSVYTVLESGKLNDLDLSLAEQNMLFAGLTQPSYPSMSGKQTTLLGHLLEKFQWKEPDHGRIAEALWLLQDPDGYKKKVREVAKSEEHASTFRKLKTEEASKAGGAQKLEDKEDKVDRRGKVAIPRRNQNFFKR